MLVATQNRICVASASECPFVEHGSANPRLFMVMRMMVMLVFADDDDDDDYLLAIQAHCNRPKGGHDDDRAGLAQHLSPPT